MTSSIRCVPTLVSFVALSCILTGCGKPTAQVSGRVTWTDGTPLEGEIRVIRFEPTADSTAEIKKAAFADIADDGSFELLTRQAGDGVYIGKYKVTFTVLKTAMGREPVLPEKYTTADASPFEMEVKSDISGLKYELERP